MWPKPIFGIDFRQESVEGATSEAIVGSHGGGWRPIRTCSSGFPESPTDRDAVSKPHEESPGSLRMEEGKQEE